jgi:lysophospholipase L1-like esterase
MKIAQLGILARRRAALEEEMEDYLDDFVGAGGTLTDFEQYVINMHIADLKDAGLWTKTKVLYLFRGFSAAQQLINVKNPGVFDGIMQGSNVTYEGSNAYFNGGSTYIKTGFNPFTELSQDSVHMGYYNLDEVQLAMGCQAGGSNNFRLLPGFGGTGNLVEANASSDNIAGATHLAYGSKSMLTSRNNSANYQVYFKDEKIHDRTVASTAAPNGEIYIGADNVVGSGAFFNSNPFRICYAHIGEGLTEAEAIQMQKLKNKFASMMGLNTYNSLIRDDAFYITDHTVSIVGDNISGTFDYVSAGTPGSTSYNITLPAVTATYGRYDLIQIDPSDQSDSYVAGTQRTVNPFDYLPTPTLYPFLHIYTNTSGVKTAIPLYYFEQNADVLVKQREYLSGIRGALAAGTAIKIAAIGDSITGQSLSTTQSASVPNGASRDILEFFQNMPSDTRTAMFGATADSTAISAGWCKRLVDYLNSYYTNNVTYDNFGIGGDELDNAITRASHVVAVSPQVIVINFGMNDVNTDVYDDLDTLIQYFQANAPSAKIIVNGCARQNGSVVANRMPAMIKNWRMQMAAMKNGVIFINGNELYNELSFVAKGLHSDHYCIANGSNHPGYKELEAYFDTLVDLLT